MGRDYRFSRDRLNGLGLTTAQMLRPAVTSGPITIAADPLAAVRLSTLALSDLRARRLAGATPQSILDKEGWLILMPLSSPGACPPEGPLAYVWEDIYNQAQANIRTLLTRPAYPEFETDPDKVLTWSALLELNALLAQDATNVRPMFLYPTLEESSGTIRQRPADPAYPLGTDHTFASGLGDFPTTSLLTPLAGERNPMPAWLLHRMYGEHALGQHVSLDYSPLDEAGRLLSNPRFVGFGHLMFHTPSYEGQKQAIRNYRSSGGRPAAVAIDNPPYQGGRTIREWNLAAWMQARAIHYRKYTTKNLAQLIMESAAFYVYNHVPWWTAHGLVTLDTESTRDTIRAMRSARFSGNMGTVGAQTVTSLIGAMSNTPIIGGIFSIMSQVGNLLVEAFIMPIFESDQPRSFWIRVPYDASCLPLTVSEQEERLRPYTEPSEGGGSDQQQVTARSSWVKPAMIGLVLLAAGGLAIAAATKKG